MKSYILAAMSAVVIGLLSVQTTFANIVLDLDAREGDQGMRSAQTKPGETKAVELVATKGAQGIAGFEVVVQFDTKQFTFKDFQPGGIMSGAITLPVQSLPNGVKISVGFLGGKSSGDKGSLGLIHLEATKDFTAGGKIALTEGSFGAQGQTEKFALNSEVSLLGAAAKDAGQQPGQPPAGTPPGQQTGPGQPPAGTPPGQQTRPGQQPGQPPAGTPPGQQTGPGQQPGQPPAGTPPGQQTGPGQQPGQPPAGTPPGQQTRPGQPPAGTPPGQQPGFQIPPGGQPGLPGGPPPNPEALISTLPTALQSTYQNTFKTSAKAHLEAALKTQESRLQTLQATKRYLANAKPEEKEAIGKVLAFFHFGGPGTPPAAPPTQGQSVDQIIDKMIEDITKDIAALKNDISTR